MPIIEPNNINNILNQEIPHQTIPDPAISMQEQAEKIISSAVSQPEQQLPEQDYSIEIEGTTFKELKEEIKRVYERDTLTDEEVIEFGKQLIKDWITYR